MSRGRPWTADDSARLRRMAQAGYSDGEIAREIACSIATVRDHRRAQGIRAHQNRSGWTRRDWLLADAAGLDFQISL